MGGAQAGEVASRIAVEAFERGLGDGGAASAEQLLAERVLEANARIHEMSQASQDRAGMGTTLTAAHVGDHDVAVAHVGDSRAYRLRGGDFERLTEDHSLVEEMRRRGQLTAQEADEHPQRSIITRALGPEPRRARRHVLLARRGRRRLPAVQRRPDVDGARVARRRHRARREQPARRRPRGSSRPPTTPAGATTSRSSCSSSRRSTAPDRRASSRRRSAMTVPARRAGAAARRAAPPPSPRRAPPRRAPPRPRPPRAAAAADARRAAPDGAQRPPPRPALRRRSSRSSRSSSSRSGSAPTSPTRPSTSSAPTTTAS